MTLGTVLGEKWLCECHQNTRMRKQFATRGEAVAFENSTMDEVNKKLWLGEKEDRRRLSEVIEQCCSLYGQTFADSKRLMAKLNIICNGLSDPVASDLTEGELVFLAPDEIKRLLDACADSQNLSLLMIVKICLATGARWSEAENLQGLQLSNTESLTPKPKARKAVPYPYLRICMTNYLETEGSYSRPVEKPLSVQ